jgi:hypothetical protein
MKEADHNTISKINPEKKNNKQKGQVSAIQNRGNGDVLRRRARA